MSVKIVFKLEVTVDQVTDMEAITNSIQKAIYRYEQSVGLAEGTELLVVRVEHDGYN